MSAEEDVQLVEAGARDAQAVLELLTQLDGQSETFTVEDDLSQLSEAAEAKQLALIQESRENLIFLAKYQGQAIGLVTIIEMPDSHLGELGVAVLKPYWNQGLGTALVEESLTWGQTFSWLDGFFLTVQARNKAAYHIYQKLGFKEIAHNKNGYHDKKGNRYPTIDMQLLFN
ncbi:GNAT family N-acetyltransferase [Pediococcus siamensis]|uniref:GNAT family N-acetyltransferase n=1 Tax=Pediococcus siamensis TaxID=381829 RepID=UPI00399F30F2